MKRGQGNQVIRPFAPERNGLDPGASVFVHEAQRQPRGLGTPLSKEAKCPAVGPGACGPFRAVKHLLPPEIRHGVFDACAECVVRAPYPYQANLPAIMRARTP